jgi:RHS repeat-associated protein
VTISATDPTGNQRVQQYQVGQSGASKTFTYDANGNLTADGTRTFEWDARNQLVAVTVGTQRSEFTYDGRQRRVRAVEKENGVVQSDTKTLWCNSAICEERAADGTTVTRRVFADGEQVAGASRFFAADHLGSVTDVTDGTATVLGRYSFDAWGRRTVTAGTDVTRVGFTGHYSQSPAGLSLAWFRAYHAELGQWISEDPAGFVDGPNLHAYVRNNPIGFVDPDGRQAQALPIIVICSPDPVTKGALIAAGIAAGVVVIWKACEDGNCFGDKEREDDRNRRCEGSTLPIPRGADE